MTTHRIALWMLIATILTLLAGALIGFITNHLLAPSALVNQPVDQFGLYFHVIGFTGMISVVTAYYGLVSNWWDKDDVRFNATNLYGGIMLFISLCIHFNLGSFIIEVFWIAIAIKGLRNFTQSQSASIQ